jgi:hypothetical protein
VIFADGENIKAGLEGNGYIMNYDVEHAEFVMKKREGFAEKIKTVYMKSKSLVVRELLLCHILKSVFIFFKQVISLRFGTNNDGDLSLQCQPFWVKPGAKTFFPKSLLVLFKCSL